MASIWCANICLLIILVEAQIETNVWVASENQVLSLSSSENKTMVLENGRHILGLSNPVLQGDQVVVFVTELGLNGPSIYSLDRSQYTQLLSPEAIDVKSPLYLESLVYDEKTDQLYLTSRNRKAIYSFPLSSSSSDSKLEKFYSSSESPTGITLDTCSRTIFWTNSNRKHPSIVSQNLETGLKTILVDTNVTRPKAITYDPYEDKVYWTDTRRGHFWLSRMDPDGGGREVVCDAPSHDAFSMTVDRHWIYWSDWSSQAVWRLQKHGSCQFEVLTSFSSSKPHGVIAIPDKKPDCIMSQFRSTTETEVVTTTETVDTTDDAANDEVVTASEEGGCANYCLHGLCYLLNDTPSCDCHEGWSGDRCHVDKCHNMCLHGGHCVILESQPECLCQPPYHGDRCHLSPVAIITSDSFCDTNNDILVMSLSITSGIMTIIVIILSVMLHRMRLRPRIVRKRFISVAGQGSSPEAKNIVKKRSDSVASCGLPVEDGIQFDIENCCNMTLCETPCFEPPTRGPKVKRYGRKNKQCNGDKSSLLANCDAED